MNIAKLLLVVATLLIAACEDEHHEAGRPGSFMEECSPDGGVTCVDPFSCLPLPSAEDDLHPITASADHDIRCKT